MGKDLAERQSVFGVVMAQVQQVGDFAKTTMNLDDALIREAMAIHAGKTKTAVVELGLQELINADRRRRLGEAFGSQPDLRPVPRRRSAPDPR